MIFCLLYCSIIFWISIFVNIQTTKAQCAGYNRTTYLLSSGYELSGGSQIQEIQDYTLEQCREACDAENVCESFMHNGDTKECLLLNASAQPLGPGQLVQLADPDMMFFQKLCIPSSQLCDSIHSFERFPQRVLVGITEEIVQVDTLSDCLKSCLESMSIFKIQCKSAMYFYDTKECVLNSIDQRQRPDLFSADTLGFIVDYFDNNCLGTVCPAPGIIQYIRTQNSELRGGKRTEISGVDLSTCKYFCNSNQDSKGGGLVCNSFMYNPSTRYCSLSSLSSQPQGRTQLTSSPGIELYEKTCFTSPSTCGNIPAFDRYPLSVLVGLSKEVITRSSLSQCLDACLQSVKQLGFICLSAMFYYDTAECILNEESRVSRPELFSYDTKGARVDYFENLCGPNPKLCGRGDDLIFIRVSNALLPGLDSSSLFPGFSPAECIQKCALEPDFVCRSVDFTEEGCSLSYQNSDAQTLTYNPPSDSIYYEAACVQDSSNCGNYFYSFTLVMGRSLIGYTSNIILGISPEDCLSMCLASTCLSINYDRHKSVCHINSESCRTVGVNSLLKNQSVDYYENKCIKSPTNCQFPLVAENMRLKQVFRVQVLNVDRIDDCKASCLASSEFACRSFTFNGARRSCELSDVDQLDVDKEGVDILQDEIAYSFYARTCEGEVEKLEASVTPECRSDGIHISVRYPRQTNGAIFVKNHFSTCRSIFRQSLVGSLLIPFPGTTNSPTLESQYNPQQLTSDCDGLEIAQQVFMYVIVVEENSGVDVPGIMTADDRIFNVTCDYSPANNGEDASASYPLGPSSSVGQIQMQILRRDHPVSAVLLGETVQLKWTIKERAPGVGYFVKDCFAERIGGNPPDPGPVKLVTKGCPDPGIHRKLMRNAITEVEDGFTTSMTVFRFDGSRSVRMRCVIEMCVDQCAPTTCHLSNGTFTSMGRRKRQMHAYYPGRDRPMSIGLLNSSQSDSSIVNMAEVSGIFTIVDSIDTKEDQKNDHDIGLGSGRQKELSALLLHNGKVCLVRPLFVGVFTFIGILTVTESSILFMYFYSRFKTQETESESQTGTGTKSGSGRTPESTSTRPSSAYFLNSDSDKDRYADITIKNRSGLPSLDHRISGAARNFRRRANQVWSKRNYHSKKSCKEADLKITNEIASSPHTPSDSDQYPESVTYGRSQTRPKIAKLIAATSGDSIKSSPPTNCSTVKSHFERSATSSRLNGVHFGQTGSGPSVDHFKSSGTNPRLSVKRNCRSPVFSVLAETHCNPDEDEEYSIPSKLSQSDGLSVHRSRDSRCVPRRSSAKHQPVISIPQKKIIHLPIPRRPAPPPYRIPPPPSALSTLKPSACNRWDPGSPDSLVGGSTLDGGKVGDATSDDGSQTQLITTKQSQFTFDNDGLLLKKVHFRHNQPGEPNFEDDSNWGEYGTSELRNEARMQSLCKQISADLL